MKRKTQKGNSVSDKIKEQIYELIQKRNITLSGTTADFLTNVQFPNDTKIRETKESIHIESKDNLMFSEIKINNDGSMERYISYGLF